MPCARKETVLDHVHAYRNTLEILTLAVDRNALQILIAIAVEHALIISV